MRQTPPATVIDRVLLQALVLVCAGVVIMVGNRWVVARQQSEVIHDLLVANARAIVEHTVGRDSEIGPDARVGPYAFLPPGSAVAAGQVTGAFYTAPAD